jgi:HD superfamily phosphohydrolase
VAGEIDVDRADYVLRGVRHYGLAAAVHGQMVTTILPKASARLKRSW